MRPFTLAPDPNPIVFHALILATVGFVVIEIVAHVVDCRSRAARRERPRDERERLIALKATSIAAYVYAVLSLSSIFIDPPRRQRDRLAYFVLFSFILAELVNYAARIVYYRRGV